MSKHRILAIISDAAIARKIADVAVAFGAEPICDLPTTAETSSISLAIVDGDNPTAAALASQFRELAPQTPLICIHGDDADEQMLCLLRPQALISKPVSLKVVRAAVKNFLEPRIEPSVEGTEWLAMLAALGQQALRGEDLHALFDHATKLAALTLKADCSNVWLLEQPAQLSTRGGYGCDERETLAIDPQSRTAAVAAFQFCRPIAVEDFATAAFEKTPVQEANGIASSLCVILPTSGAPSGVLAAHWRTPRRFTASEHHFLQAIATVLGAATQRSQAIEQVTRERNLLRTLMDNLPDFVYLKDVQGRYVLCNRAMANFVGLETPDQIIGRMPHDCFPADIAEGFAREDRDVLRTGRQMMGEERCVRSLDGREMWHLTSKIQLRDKDGRTIGLAGIARDVTEQRRIANALRISEERCRSIIEEAVDLIYSHDLNGRFTSFNKAGEMITGYTRAEIMSMTLDELVAPDCRDFVHRMIDPTIGGNAGTAYELALVAKDGRRLLVEVNTRFILEEGQPVGIQGIARDVAKRKKLEAELLQSQKMQAVGRLAGGIAHDFNNLMTAVITYAELILMRLSDDHPIRVEVEEIKNAGLRAAALTRQLLTFSRRQIVSPTLLNLNEIVSGLEKMLRRLIGEDIELITQLSPQIGSVKIDPGQLEQVIVNLVVNARDAMPNGGRLFIRTTEATPNDAVAAPSGNNVGGEYIVIEVADTGIGMNAEVRSHLFEPFFTTKEQGRGTGLGLSTVYGIVTQVNGFIQVQSEPGAGSIFRVHLPKAGAQLNASKAAHAGASMPRGTETILLVEDDELVRRITRRILADHGYKVIDASDGEAGLRELEKRSDGQLDILLTDIIMPRLSGKELADRALKMRPTLRVMYLSGYTDHALEEKGALGDGIELLQKPFTPTVLLSRIRAVLDAQS